VSRTYEREASVEEVSPTGLDIAKSVFRAHGTDAAGREAFSKRIARAKLLGFLAGQPRCLVAMEACGSAHHWARELARMGHHVRLMPPAYVRPVVKRQKNDAADAEAICEAAQRPNTRFVAVKSEEQQASGPVFRTRDPGAAPASRECYAESYAQWGRVCIRLKAPPLGLSPFPAIGR